MGKPQEDPLNRTLNPALPTAISASNTPQNSNPPPPSSISDDPRVEGEMRDQKKESNLKHSNATVATLEAAVASGVAVDLEKKLRRAERFGVAIQLSEEEKRRTRAERFGTSTGSPLHGVKNGGESEELKRKARAERFGLAVQSPADEEAKKKARLERFGQVSKPDNLEEEKRKARAARFSQSSTVSSKINGKALSDMKATVAIIKEDPKG